MSGPACVENGSVAVFHLGKAFDGELPHCFGSGHLAKALQRNGGDVEVVVAERGLPLRAEDVATRRSARPRACAGNALDLDDAVAGQVVQVAADGGRSEAEKVTELGGTDGTVLQDGVTHAVPRALVSVGRMHRCEGRRRHLRHPRRALPGKGGRGRWAHGIHNTIMS